MSVRSGVFHMTKFRPGLVRLRPSEFFLAVHERDTSTSLRDVALFVDSRSMTEVLLGALSVSNKTLLVIQPDIRFGFSFNYVLVA